MSLDEEIRQIFKENQERMTIAAVMEVVDQLSDMICEFFAEELDIHYEDVEEKLIIARRKIREHLEELEKQRLEKRRSNNGA